MVCRSRTYTTTESITVARRSIVMGPIEAPAASTDAGMVPDAVATGSPRKSATANANDAVACTVTRGAGTVIS
jgi:hypothetical protein